MKCPNCGYSNATEVTSCVKCNTRLDMRQNHDAGRVPEKVPGVENIAKTMMGQQPKEPFIDRPAQVHPLQEGDALSPQPVSCSQCGYPVMFGSSHCPNCNTPVQPSKGDVNPVYRVNRNEKPISGTIDPFSRKGFSLRPIINGVPSSNVLEFVENSVKLNRSNTLTGNMTITSKTQAEITNRDGVWTILDHSESKSTFVQAGEPKEIKKGDIIVMGDTKFIFE